ncbi:MAG TPA: T9SS type A sorting domain-containing protein [Ignavibacteria bacterium]
MKNIIIIILLFAFNSFLIFSQNNTLRKILKYDNNLIIQKNVNNKNIIQSKGLVDANTKINSNNIIGPNLIPFMPSQVSGFGWDDVIIASHTTKANKNAKAIYDDADIYLSFAVLNNGTSSVNTKFYVKIFIDGYDLFMDYYDKELPPNNFVYWRDLNIGKLTSGVHIVSLYADYTNAVYESDETDNNYSRYLIVIHDSLPPVIYHTPPSSAEIGKPITIKASAIDYETFTTKFYLNYRISGNLWDDNLKVNFIGDSAVIPGAYVTDKGLDYLIIASDGNDNYDYFYFPNDNYSHYYSVPVIVPYSNITPKKFYGGSSYTSYRLFSLPYDFGTVIANILFQSLGDFKKGWRLRTLAGNNIFVDAETLPLENNKAYFLITRNDCNILPNNNARTNRLNYYDYMGMSIKSGWNLIGNPFPFRVAVSKLRILNPNNNEFVRVNDAYEYMGDRGWLKADYLNPWEGLAIYSDYDSKLHFLVGYDNILKEQNKYSFNENEWISQIVVSNDETIDEENYFGVQKKALKEKDDYDRPEPPLIGEGVAIYFPHKDWNMPIQNFSTDIQSTQVNGNEWSFVLYSGSKKDITLTFNNISNQKNDIEKYLVDIESNILFNLSKQNVIKLPGFIGEKQFKIIVGNRFFVEQQSKLSLIPSEYKVFNNYPNPFNLSTNFVFSLPQKSNVKVTLYDTYGREVKQIENKEYESGYYNILINANNLSSGVYFCKFEINGARKIIDTKKIVLIK